MYMVQLHMLTQVYSVVVVWVACVSLWRGGKYAENLARLSRMNGMCIRNNIGIVGK